MAGALAVTLDLEAEGCILGGCGKEEGGCVLDASIELLCQPRAAFYTKTNFSLVEATVLFSC